MISEQQRKVFDLFREGRKLYTMQKFAEARAVFLRACEIDKEDGPSYKFRERCEKYLKKPPGDDWDGVYDAETK